MDTYKTYRFPFAAYPAVRLAILLVWGITLDYHFNPTTDIWLLSFGIFSGIYLLFEWIHRHKLQQIFYSGTIVAYLGLILTFGGIWHSLWDYRTPPPSATVINSYTWEELSFTGTIQQIKETSTGKFQLDIAINTTVFPDQIKWKKSFTIRAVLDPADLNLPSSTRLGSRIRFSGIVYPLDAPTNPSQFNYKDYLASIGIYTQVGIKTIAAVHPVSEDGLKWSIIRQHVLDAINNNFSDQTAPLAKALLIGYKNELQRSEKIAFSRAGLSHIMAVSGLHVGFVLAPFWFIIPFFWTFRYGKIIGLATLIGFLYFYAGLTGFSASVTRASLVGGLLAYGKLFHKIRNSINITAVAALIILLINPSDLFNIGFQLSFGAVYIILLTAPVISQGLPKWIRFRWYGEPLMIVIISFIVQIGLFPLLAYYFGEFSIIGPLANAFVVPILGLAIPFALLLLLVSIFLPGLSQMLNIPVEYFLQGLDLFVTTASSWSWSWLQVHVDSPLFFMIWASFIFLVATLSIPKLRWKVFILLLILLCMNQGNYILKKMTPASLTVTIFDVGQGDAALVSTPRERHFLIDTGRWRPNYNSAKYIILPHLKAKGIKHLDAVFLSHPHADHIGGILELIDHIPIDTIYNSGTTYDSKLYQTYRRKAVQKNIPTVALNTGDIISLDPSVRIFVYSPDPNTPETNINNRSLVLELIYGDTEFLFLGDAEQKQEQQLVESYPQLVDTDFLKVAHHGSKTSSTTPLLQHTSASIGVVSLALQNRFRHPHPEANRRLHSYIDSLHYTSIEGAATFRSDGKTIYQTQ